MKKLAELLERRRLAGLRRPTVVDALLMRRMHVYARLRLLPFLSVRAFSFAIRFVELTFFFEVFGQRAAIGLFSVQLVFDCVISTWWGALEAMRERLREAPEPPARKHALSVWYSRAFLLAPLATVIAFVAGASQLDRLEPFALIYLGIRAAILAVDLVLRTAHSGIFAFARVYRPPLSLYLPELVLPLVVVFLRAPAGRWAFVIAAFVHGGLSRWISFYYLRQAYHFHRQAWPTFNRVNALERGSAEERTVAFEGALAGLLTRAIELLALGFAVIGMFKHRETLAPLLWYSVLSFPLVRAATAWPLLFYQDIVYLDIPEAQRLLRRFVRTLPIFALVVASLLAGLAVLGFFLAFGSLFWPYLATFVVCLFGLALASAVQLIDFARGRRLLAATNAFVLVITLLAARGLELSVELTFWFVALAPFLALAVRGVAGRFAVERHGVVASRVAFEREIARRPGPLRYGTLIVMGAKRRQRRSIALWLWRRLRPLDGCVWQHGQTLMFVRRPGGSDARLTAQVMRRTAGSLRRLELDDEALKERLARPAQRPPLGEERFLQAFPAGFVIDFDRLDARPLRRMEPHAVRRLWQRAVALARGEGFNQASELLIRPHIVDGMIVALMCAPVGKDQKRRFHEHFGSDTFRV